MDKAQEIFPSSRISVVHVVLYFFPVFSSSFSFFIFIFQCFSHPLQLLLLYSSFSSRFLSFFLLFLLFLFFLFFQLFPSFRFAFFLPAYPYFGHNFRFYVTFLLHFSLLPWLSWQSEARNRLLWYYGAQVAFFPFPFPFFSCTLDWFYLHFIMSLLRLSTITSFNTSTYIIYKRR